MIKQRILVAEDDPSLLKMTKRRLEHTGYEVVAVTTGEEVLTQIDGQRGIDLILLDLHAAGLDGFEVCRRLLTNPTSASIPVILFTAAEAYLDPLTNLCRELGASDYLGKPFRLKELLEKVRTVLKKQKPAHQATTGQSGASKVTARPQGRTRVLVVDDDRKSREIFVQALQAPEFQVVAVGSGQEAVGAVNEAPFSLAFVDVIMPGMDGLATLKALRAEQPQLPVIMMTGYQVEDLVALALKIGAVDFLRKPFKDASLILSAVHRVRN